MGVRKDIWRVFLIKKSMEEIIKLGALPSEFIDITGNMGFYTFLADPFGIVKEDYIYICRIL